MVPLIPALTWIALLVRYPKRTLAVALPLLALLLVIAARVQWVETRTESLLAQLQMSIEYAPQDCPADLPLRVRIDNNSGRALDSLSWRIAAYRPGERTNLVEERYNSPAYSGDSPLAAGQHWEHCLPLPQLRSGYRASSLEFRIEQRKGRFL